MLVHTVSYSLAKLQLTDSVNDVSSLPVLIILDDISLFKDFLNLNSGSVESPFDFKIVWSINADLNEQPNASRRSKHLLTLRGLLLAFTM